VGENASSDSDDQAWNAWGAVENVWLRLRDDLARTTGRTLRLAESDSEPGALEVHLDGVLYGWFGHQFSADPEAALAELAAHLCEFALDEEIWGGWPICPRHHTHPLSAATTDVARVAWWHCPKDGVSVARIGDLAEVGGRDQR
jgi:hypothetical protein